MVIKAEDCGTTQGIYVGKIVTEGDVIETLSTRCRGRTSLERVSHPRNKDVVICEAGDAFDDRHSILLDEVDTTYNAERETAKSADNPDTAIEAIEAEYRRHGFRIGEHGELQISMRSPLTCDLESGICAKCYGWDLSTRKFAEVGLAAGVIAAETMSEPLSQLTMRTFHHGGVATGTVLTGYNQAGRMYGTLHQELKADLKTDELEAHEMPDFIGEQRGLLDELTGKAQRQKEEAEKGTKKTKKSETPPPRTTANRQLARELVEHSFYHYVGIPFVERLLEARRAPKGEAVVTHYDGIIDTIKIGLLGRWIVIRARVKPKEVEVSGKTIAEKVLHPQSGETVYEAGTEINKAVLDKLAKLKIHEITIFEVVLLPKRRILLVEVGDKVKAGDPLTQGPLDLGTLLEFRGIRAVQEYLVTELQSLYKSNGVSINDRHLEVICRQMLRKVRIREGGDSKFLPGQTVDRFAFRRENERIQQMIAAREEVEYEDPETGEIKKRIPVPATADAVIQGITEAALTTESFLSAASAQKTVRVLTDAAVKGRTDDLVGLKENVIIGRLIPAGSGFPAYRNIAVKTTREPIWARAPITALASMQEQEAVGELEELSEEDIGDIRTLAESLGAENLPEEEPQT
jgi:DNA-directed RNA polymerase subunit beta'